MSVAVALATTVVFLIFLRISEALGAGGAMSPIMAAWVPNLIFLAAGAVLYWRVRT